MTEQKQLEIYRAISDDAQNLHDELMELQKFSGPASLDQLIDVMRVVGRIAGQLAQPADGHPEDICADCGRPNAEPWFTASEIWNRVMRNGGPEPIICPVCFIERAHKTGIQCTGWELKPENLTTEHADDKVGT